MSQKSMKTSAWTIQVDDRDPDLDATTAFYDKRWDDCSPEEQARVKREGFVGGEACGGRKWYCVSSKLWHELSASPKPA